MDFQIDKLRERLELTQPAPVEASPSPTPPRVREPLKRGASYDVDDAIVWDDYDDDFNIIGGPSTGSFFGRSKIKRPRPRHLETKLIEEDAHLSPSETGYRVNNGRPLLTMVSSELSNRGFGPRVPAQRALVTDKHLPDFARASGKVGMGHPKLVNGRGYKAL